MYKPVISKNLYTQTVTKIGVGKNLFLFSKNLNNQTLAYPFLINSTTTTNTNIWVLKKIKRQQIATPLPLVMRFAKVATISVDSAKKILHQILSDLVNNFSFNTLYFFFKKLFWIIPVPKHKQLLYLIRALVKVGMGVTSNLTGLSITLRGKLAATGNKRTTTFSVVSGNGSASQLSATNVTDFRNIHTATGILGVTSIITYIR